jgi:hypothetical protein
LRADNPEFDSPHRQEIVLHSVASRPALGPTESDMKWVLEDSYPGIKRPGGEADCSLSPRAEARVSAVVLPLPYSPSWRDVRLIKPKDNFTLFAMAESYGDVPHTLRQRCARVHYTRDVI